MNNVQFITWKPIYWIQHLALSPIPSIFQHSLWKKKKKRKEIQTEFNSQSRFLDCVLREKSMLQPCILVIKFVITMVTFTCLQLRARSLLVFLCFLPTLLCFSDCREYFQGHTTDSSLVLWWQKKRSLYKNNNRRKLHWNIADESTTAVQGHNRSESVTTSSLKQAAIVMLNISSPDWERNSERPQERSPSTCLTCVNQEVLGSGISSQELTESEKRQGGRNRDGLYC